MYDRQYGFELEVMIVNGTSGNKWDDWRYSGRRPSAECRNGYFSISFVSSLLNTDFFYFLIYHQRGKNANAGHFHGENCGIYSNSIHDKEDFSIVKFRTPSFGKVSPHWFFSWQHGLVPRVSNRRKINYKGGFNDHFLLGFKSSGRFPNGVLSRDASFFSFLIPRTGHGRVRTPYGRVN